MRRGDGVWLRRVCPDHGETEALIWRGAPDFGAWRAAGAGSSCCGPAPNPACPTECGLCFGHARETCCVLLELTQRCDLECPVCFAGAGSGAAEGVTESGDEDGEGPEAGRGAVATQRGSPEDPSIEVVEGWFRRLLAVAPGCNVQLSGGEPTVRDDLPEIIAVGRALGHGFLQLNTNGLRLAREAGYAERLARAGLSTVFLQFDGVDDAPYLALRGRPLAAAKDEAVRRCAQAGLGVVLVPTVVRGVNLDRLGDILDYALAHVPAVRGVHVQPMALLGRHTASGDVGEERVTLPDVMRALAEQSGGLIRLADLTPGDCEHALCSFSREYLRRGDGSLSPMGAPRDSSCGCGAPGIRPTTAAPGDRSASGIRDGRPVEIAATAKAAHVAARWSGARPAGRAERLAATAARPAAAGERCASPAADDCCAQSSAAGCFADPPSPVDSASPSPGPAPDQWDAIISDIHANAFSVSGMAFQDAWTIDLDRLRYCYLHVLAADGRVVPFCSYYLTPAGGERLLRTGGAAARPEAVAAGSAGGEPAIGRDCGCGGELVVEPYRGGCMICGAAITYHRERELTCHYCGAVVMSAGSCDSGHFVCDVCHGAAAVEIIKRVCLASGETDAMALMRVIREHPAFAVHGPEHHSLVPAVILTALRNRGAPVDDGKIVTAIERGRGVGGGACALLGVCGAASGLGIAVSLLLEADPLDGGKRQAVQQAAERALAAIAALNAPRCCQRDSWLALREAAELLPDVAGVSLGTVESFPCEQWRANAECIGVECPLWPAAVKVAASPES